jgi:hypothetical protein
MGLVFPSLFPLGLVFPTHSALYVSRLVFLDFPLGRGLGTRASPWFLLAPPGWLFSSLGLVIPTNCCLSAFGTRDSQVPLFTVPLGLVFPEFGFLVGSSYLLLWGPCSPFVSPGTRVSHRWLFGARAPHFGLWISVTLLGLVFPITALRGSCSPV